MKTALITGITGQAGAYLGKLLLSKGYKVYGTSRDLLQASLSGMDFLDITDKITIRNLDLLDKDHVHDLIDQICPDEIYHLAAPSSVSRSFSDPVEAVDGIVLSTLHILEAIRLTDKSIRFFTAGSTEIFGECRKPATENSPHRPMSPYGIGKSSAHQLTKLYRQAYNMYVCNGIMSNFESPLRQKNYVTAKIISKACNIALGENSNIELGNLDITRDWGYAPEYMEAAWLGLQQDNPADYIISTGQSYSLRYFLEIVFTHLGLEYNDHLTQSLDLLRPLDIYNSMCNPNSTRKRLGWQSKSTLSETILIMLTTELSSLVGDKQADQMLNRKNVIAFKASH